MDMNAFRRLVLVGLVLALVAGCSLIEDEDGDEDVEATATPIASPLPPVGADRGVEADGKVVPVRRAALGFVIGGTVDEVLVEEGALVRKGQTLVRLEGGQQAAALLAAEADLRVAEARLAQAETDAGAAAREADRLRAAELERASEGPGTAVDAEAVAAAESRLERLEAEVEAAMAVVDQAEARLEQAYVQTDQLALTAPFDGTVAAIDVAPAEVVTPGVAVVQMGDVSSWVIETDNLTERDIVGIEPGAEAVLAFPAIEGLELAGTVDRVRPLGQPRLGDVVYTVVIRPDRHEPRLRWNMTAEVTIEPPEE